MRILRTAGPGFLVLGALVVLAAPAGVHELLRAGGHDNGSGGVAFIAFTLMVFAIGFALFFMDRVRRRASDDERH